MLYLGVVVCLLATLPKDSATRFIIKRIDLLCVAPRGRGIKMIDTFLEEEQLQAAGWRHYSNLGFIESDEETRECVEAIIDLPPGLISYLFVEYVNWLNDYKHLPGSPSDKRREKYRRFSKIIIEKLAEEKKRWAVMVR